MLKILTNCLKLSQCISDAYKMKINFVFKLSCPQDIPFMYMQIYYILKNLQHVKHCSQVFWLRDTQSI